MDMEKMIRGVIAKQRQDELNSSSQLLLGELILKLEAVENKELPLFIDDEVKEPPMSIDSWRGSYDELAIQTQDMGSYYLVDDDYTNDGDGWMKTYDTKTIGKENPTVKEWIEILKEAVDKYFQGYKGGYFKMSKNTPVWYGEYGNSSPLGESFYFTDVREEKDKVYLVTKEEEVT